MKGRWGSERAHCGRALASWSEPRSVLCRGVPRPCARPLAAHPSMTYALTPVPGPSAFLAILILWVTTAAGSTAALNIVPVLLLAIHSPLEAPSPRTTAEYSTQSSSVLGCFVLGGVVESVAVHEKLGALRI